MKVDDHLERVRAAWDAYDDAQKQTRLYRNVVRKEIEKAMRAGIPQSEIARSLTAPRQHVNRLLAVDRLGSYAIEAVMTVPSRRGVSREQRHWFERSLTLLASRGLVAPSTRWVGDRRVEVRLGVVAESRKSATDVAGHIIKRRAQFDAEIAPAKELVVEFVSVVRERDYVG